MQEKTFIRNYITDDNDGSSMAEAAVKCAQVLCAPEDLDEAFCSVLKLMCSMLHAERTYLYQLSQGQWQLSYEYPPGLEGQGQTCPDHVCGEWPGDESLTLQTLESIRETLPWMYEQLLSRGVNRAVIVPLNWEGSVIGYFGVENPAPDRVTEVGTFLQMLSCTMAMALSAAEKERELNHLRLYDNLTGVFHRGIFLSELKHVRMRQESIGIIHFQITDMKHLNECYGYDHGDEVLIKCVQQASALFHDAGKLYRVGCDELAVICTEIGKEEFERLANQLSPVMEQSIHCMVAVGYQWTSQVRTIERLDLAAQSMMEEDKRRYTRLQALAGRHQMIQEDTYGMLTVEGVTSLLEAERFMVYLQPKLSFRDGSLVGAEALVRFMDLEGRVVEPGYFLPDLEAAMLIKYVDFYVFEKACRLIRSWHDDEPHKYTAISVNFSRMTLAEPNLVPHLLHICRKYDVEPEHLEVEIAGSADKQQAADLNRTVDKIRTAGFVVSVDDFGIRFANLSLLISLDCDKLKVDRSLVENVATNTKAQSVLRALAALCTATGTKTTIEGIETEEQLSILKTMGFDEMQGYLISLPLTIEQFWAKYFSC